MKTILTLVSLILFSVMSFAGVEKFSAKHVVEPSAKIASYPVRHPVKSVKSSAKAGVKVVKVAKKVVF